MTQTHRIHLRGPWEYEWLSPARADGDAAPMPRETSGRVKLPANWQTLFGDVSGTVRFRRRFHRPTNLEPHERVFIVFDGLEGTAEVSVNESPLGRIDDEETSRRFDVTVHLLPANTLTVDVTYNADRDRQGGGLYAPVAIEIRSA